MYMPFPYCLLFGDIKKLIIEAVAMPFIRAKIWLWIISPQTEHCL